MSLVHSKLKIFLLRNIENLIVSFFFNRKQNLSGKSVFPWRNLQFYKKGILPSVKHCYKNSCSALFSAWAVSIHAQMENVLVPAPRPAVTVAWGGLWNTCPASFRGLGGVGISHVCLRPWQPIHPGSVYLTASVTSSLRIMQRFVSSSSSDPTLASGKFLAASEAPNLFTIKTHCLA